MVIDTIDFSFLGVSNIWNNDLGLSPRNILLPFSRIVDNTTGTRIRSHTTNDIRIGEAIVNLVNFLDLPDISLPKTSKPFNRRLCLHACGFSSNPKDLLSKVQALALSGHSTEGALHALLLDNTDLAFIALRSGPRHQQNKALSIIVSIYAENKSTDQLQSRIATLTSGETDSFARGIMAYITTQPAPSTLPPIYQVAIALKTLSDAALTTFLSQLTTNAVRNGLPSHLPLTGLTSKCIPLFTTYLERTSDIQSTVLALAYTSPRYIRHPRLDAWREAYRSELNSWRLYLRRATFDVQATKLATTWSGVKMIEPTKRQFTLRCSNCDGALHREQLFHHPASTSDATATPPKQTQVLGSTKEGTMCPRCGARLPRCVVCDHWVGEADPRSKGMNDRDLVSGGMNANNLSGKDKGEKEDRSPLSDLLVEICLRCQHIYHRGHANEWFK